MKNFIVYIFALLSLFACSKGPETSYLQNKVHLKLEKHFHENLFTITDFSRRGSYGYNDLETNENKLLIYYKTKLKFNRDYKLTDWNKLNVGSLTSILGATASGIQGVLPEGNKSGDKLVVYGTLNFKKSKAGWIATNSISSKNKLAINKKTPGEYIGELDKEIELSSDNKPKYKQYLTILDKIFATYSLEKDMEPLKLAEAELKSILRKTQLYTAKNKGQTTIATASPLGDYYALGKGISKINKSKIKIKSFSTTGSVENCHLTNNKDTKVVCQE